MPAVHAYSQIDPDTAMNVHSWSAMTRAAGAALAATDAVIAGELENAFCAVRPPGHHACRDRAMGFCFFNNIAIAAKYALERHGLQRVAVVDFDVHHGNGTEDILGGDERVLMVGIFQHPFYPYTGADSHAANMVNLPVPAYTRGMDIRELIEQDWMPRLEAFKPADDLHQRRFRRPPRGRPRAARAGRGGLHLDHHRGSRTSPGSMRPGASCRRSKAATTSARWDAASRRTCASWPISDRELAEPTMNDAVTENRDARGVVTLTMNRPANFNALSEEMLAALQQALDRLAQDDVAARGRAGRGRQGVLPGPSPQGNDRQAVARRITSDCSRSAAA